MINIKTLNGAELMGTYITLVMPILSHTKASTKPQTSSFHALIT